MDIRRRPRPTTETTETPTRPGRDGEETAALDRARRTERLLAAADDAIARALSSDSAQFLVAARQTGGQ